MKMVTVKTFDNYFSANIILARLQHEGVTCFLKDEHSVTICPVLGNAFGGIKLVVSNTDLAVAVALLHEFDEEYLQDAQCPVCGGHDITLISKPEAANFLTSVLSRLFPGYTVPTETLYQCQQCGHENHDQICFMGTLTS